MTTSVIAHNAHREFTVRVMDRVWDEKTGVMTDEWKEVQKYRMKPGEMWQRRVASKW